MKRLRALALLPWGLLLLGPAGSALAAPGDAEAVRPWKGSEVLDDPQWRQRFLGSYGVLSGVEPDIQESERELLSEVLQVMETSPEAAAERLAEDKPEGSSAALDFILANLYFQTGETEKAVAAYRESLEKFPDFRRAHKNLGLLNVQQNDCEAALPHLSRAAELGDRDARNFGLMGYCYIDQEEFLAAEAAYRNAILQEPGERDWKLGLARSLLAMEEYRAATSLFDALIAADPGNATFWKLQANGYIGLEKPMDAASNLEAVRLMGEADSSSLVLLGDIYMNEGVYELAKQAYLEVIERDEKTARYDTAYRAAELLVRTQSYGEAQEILSAIDRRYDDLTKDQELDVLTLEAKVARGQGREAEAAKLLETIVQRDGTRGEALLELASYRQGQGETEKAILLLERAQRLQDVEYQARLEHAKIMVAEKEYAKAAELLRSALQIQQEPRVERFLARLEKVIGSS